MAISMRAVFAYGTVDKWIRIDYIKHKFVQHVFNGLFIDDDDDDDDLPPLKSARHGHSTIFVCGGIIPIIEL